MIAIPNEPFEKRRSSTAIQFSTMDTAPKMQSPSKPASSSNTEAIEWFFIQITLLVFELQPFYY